MEEGTIWLVFAKKLNSRKKKKKNKGGIRKKKSFEGRKERKSFFLFAKKFCRLYKAKK